MVLGYTWVNSLWIRFELLCIGSNGNFVSFNWDSRKVTNYLLLDLSMGFKLYIVMNCGSLLCAPEYAIIVWYVQKKPNIYPMYNQFNDDKECIYTNPYISVDNDPPAMIHEN